MGLTRFPGINSVHKIYDSTKKGVPHNWFEEDRNWKPHHRQRQNNNAFVNIKTTIKTGLFN